MPDDVTIAGRGMRTARVKLILMLQHPANSPSLQHTLAELPVHACSCRLCTAESVLSTFECSMYSGRRCI